MYGGLRLLCRGTSSGPGGKALAGLDERLPVEESDLADLARSSLTALIAPGRHEITMTPDGNGSVVFAGPTLVQARNVCDSEFFAKMPSLAKGGGVLIDEDLVLTVGHIVERAEVEVIPNHFTRTTSGSIDHELVLDLDLGKKRVTLARAGERHMFLCEIDAEGAAMLGAN